MWILPLIGYLGVLLGFVFLTLAIASGLYYLSELVEEHTVPAKKLLTRLIYAVVILLASLTLADGFPKWLGLLSVASHLVYARNLRRFPVVKLTDPTFLLSCALVLVNHYLWYRLFSNATPRRPGFASGAYASQSYDNSGAAGDLPSFTEVASFFGLCVWLVPFALFISLSAGEYVLPSMGSEYATGQGSSFISAGAAPPASVAAPGPGGRFPQTGRRPRSNTANAGMAKAVVNGVRGWVDETGAVMGFWNGENVRPL